VVRLYASTKGLYALFDPFCHDATTSKTKHADKICDIILHLILKITSLGIDKAVLC
jgi:hypothetical protein